MIINRIVEDVTDFVIKKESIPNGCYIRVKAGAGKKGDGQFGGSGGFGQVKSLFINGTNDIHLSAFFRKNAENGLSMDSDEKSIHVYAYEFKGGSAGQDIDCCLNIAREKINIHCNGGGGGGASGQIIYTDDDSYKLNGLSGGKNSKGELNYSAFGLTGGRGQDGVPDSYLNDISGQFVSEYPYNEKDAEIVIEAC